MGLKSIRYPASKLPSIRVYLVSMNLALLLLFMAISLLFWQQISNFYQTEQAEDIVSIHEAMQARSASLVRSMALSANQAITGYDFSFLINLMKQVTDGDQDIQYCMVLSNLGQVVAHNRVDQVGSLAGTPVDKQALALLEDEFIDDQVTDFSIQVIDTPGAVEMQSQMMQVVTPVFNGQELWGILYCGISLAGMQESIDERTAEWDEEISRIWIFYITVAAIFILFGFMVSLFITRRLLRAVDQLDAGVKEVSAGDLNYRLSMQGLMCSEFGTFATSFNRMASNLESSHRTLDEYNRSLEYKVEERTVELARSNKELEAFNYSVSHDLRAPLRSIEGFSQVLSEEYQESLDETGLDYLRRVRAAASRMGVLIDDMLRLSRLGRQEMQTGEVDLSELANATLSKLAESEPERQVSFQVEPGLMVQGDRRLLAIALDNLIGNAWKYTGRREKAEIVFGKAVKEGKSCYFVQDNGAGFDMRYADKLFGAFQRLHKSSDFEGTGIGLATVARIMHRHGGSVWAESEVDAGATFYFQLP
ncbi:MAG: ATP-binding protein [Candidatus Thiodiazotropha endolucinida]|nr:ATP-binding protein [Candidatus Thiodiazotropha taylori]MCW4316180.1 ATP-binding protein [Candidatus Thiodiazotropha taylori]